MKPSHERTPRSIEECCFAMNADPIEYGEKPMHKHDKIVITACAIAVVCLAIILGVYQ